MQLWCPSRLRILWTTSEHSILWRKTKNWYLGRYRQLQLLWQTYKHKDGHGDSMTGPGPEGRIGEISGRIRAFAKYQVQMNIGIISFALCFFWFFLLDFNFFNVNGTHWSLNGTRLSWIELHGPPYHPIVIDPINPLRNTNIFIEHHVIPRNPMEP